jgi:hypothetical protein
VFVDVHAGIGMNWLEAKFFNHEFGKGAPPNKSSLFESIKSVVEADNLMLLALSLEAFRLTHVYLLVEFAIQIGLAYVKTGDMPVFE